MRTVTWRVRMAPARRAALPSSGLQHVARQPLDQRMRADQRDGSSGTGRSKARRTVSGSPASISPSRTARLARERSTSTTRSPRTSARFGGERLAHEAAHVHAGADRGADLDQLALHFLHADRVLGEERARAAVALAVGLGKHDPFPAPGADEGTDGEGHGSNQASANRHADGGAREGL